MDREGPAGQAAGVGWGDGGPDECVLPRTGAAVLYSDILLLVVPVQVKAAFRPNPDV